MCVYVYYFKENIYLNIRDFYNLFKNTVEVFNNNNNKYKHNIFYLSNFELLILVRFLYQKF